MRLVANTGKPLGGWWHHRDLLGTTEVVLASTDPESLKRREKVEKPTAPLDETSAQRAKRIEKEEQIRVERREDRALARKQKADVSWLGVTAAQVLGPQLTISGPTLAFVAGFIGDRVKVWGSWPEIKDAIEANAQAMQGAGVKEVERLLREAIVLHLVNQAVTTYDAKQLYDWKRAVGLITRVSDDLGTTLPKGWNAPPVHQTDANCHVCGRFTPNDHITKIDESEGWQTSDGVVTCSDACRANMRSSSKSAPKPPTKNPAKQAQKKGESHTLTA